MITDKINPILTIHQLAYVLNPNYQDVRIRGMNHLSLTYQGTKIHIIKKKAGFDVSPDIPLVVFFVIFGVLFFVSLILSPSTGIILGILPAAIIFWIYSEIYASSKKDVIKQFCDTLPDIEGILNNYMNVQNNSQN